MSIVLLVLLVWLGGTFSNLTEQLVHLGDWLQLPRWLFWAALAGGLTWLSRD